MRCDRHSETNGEKEAGLRSGHSGQRVLETGTRQEKEPLLQREGVQEYFQSHGGCVRSQADGSRGSSWSDRWCGVLTIHVVYVQFTVCHASRLKSLAPIHALRKKREGGSAVQCCCWASERRLENGTGSVGAQLCGCELERVGEEEEGQSADDFLEF